MGLQLVERGLELPALGVEPGEVAGRGALGLQDRRREAVGAVLGLGASRVVDLVGYDPHGSDWSLLRRGELRAERAVVEALGNREHRVRLHSPDELGAALRELTEQLVAPAKASVGEDEHARADRGGERCGDSVLPIARSTGTGREHRMRAALGEGDEPDLGERGLSAPGVVAPEGGEVARRVGDMRIPANSATCSG